MHPSLRVVRSRFPALTIWRMNVGDGVPAPVELDGGGEDALILRATSDVQVRSMPPGGAEFVTALARGESLEEATKGALGAAPSFDLTMNLSALLDAGAFIGFSLVAENAPKEPSPP